MVKQKRYSSFSEKTIITESWLDQCYLWIKCPPCEDSLFTFCKSSLSHCELGLLVALYLLIWFVEINSAQWRTTEMYAPFKMLNAYSSFYKSTGYSVYSSSILSVKLSKEKISHISIRGSYDFWCIYLLWDPLLKWFWGDTFWLIQLAIPYTLHNQIIWERFA